MKVQAFELRGRGTGAEFEFIFVPSDVGLEGLPDEVRAELGEVEFFKEFDLKPGTHRIALNTPEAIREIERQGYYRSTAGVSIPKLQNVPH